MPCKQQQEQLQLLWQLLEKAPALLLLPLTACASDLPVPFASGGLESPPFWLGELQQRWQRPAGAARLKLLGMYHVVFV